MKCPVCLKEIHGRFDFYPHMYAEHVNIDEENVYKSMTRNVNSSIQPTRCYLCSEIFEGDFALSKHFDEVHTKPYSSNSMTGNGRLNNIVCNTRKSEQKYTLEEVQAILRFGLG